MQFIGIIPARYASTRFPGKPLVDIQGKPMIQRVYERASLAKHLSSVHVATDDERIAAVVRNFGGKVIMTSDKHPSGTDRCYEACEQLLSDGISAETVVINIQGDEPFIHPEQIDLLCSCFQSNNTSIATLARKITDNESIFNVNTPKVIFNTHHQAIYFSRSPIPHLRGVESYQWAERHTFYRHIGIYAYRANILKQLTQLPPSSLEKAESLEQLRWLENGYTIQIAVTEHDSYAVDTPEDIHKLPTTIR